MNDRDRRLLTAIRLIGPVTPHALAFHPIESRFETYDELVEALDDLADQGHLRKKTVVDVSGDQVTEYEAADK